MACWQNEYLYTCTCQRCLIYWVYKAFIGCTACRRLSLPQHLPCSSRGEGRESQGRGMRAGEGVGAGPTEAWGRAKGGFGAGPKDSLHACNLVTSAYDVSVLLHTTFALIAEVLSRQTVWQSCNTTQLYLIMSICNNNNKISDTVE